MKINELHVIGNFRYLWLKSVNGVNLSQHCARCLIGSYDSRISPKLREYRDLPLIDGIYYLCGVSTPYRWINNFHLAFRNKPGNIIKVERNGIYIEIQDAEILEFGENDINWNLPQAKDKSFSTCRNWQFANAFYKYTNNG